ncbi:TenA family protein [Propionicicella superfundia]|uniref:TenA family protein n=1 Tax=Propionicicella superfundia TaxID=348582 RepID=UPI000406DA74|nr:TenA family protein [Propionicicella superfundia]
MRFTDRLWEAIVPIRAAIGEHPFLQTLGDGTLDRDLFVGYLTQDALYLGQYGRVLAGLATMATDPADLVFWATGARESIEVERQLHASHVADPDAATMSPTSRAYTSYLLSLLAGGNYAEAATGVLPCYWVYQDVGNELLERAGRLDDHPFADWIGLYSDPAFAGQVEQARRIVDRLGDAADETTAARMTTAFVTASRYEWMFWDAAWRREPWPV